MERHAAQHEIEIHLIFDYVIQQVPTRTQRQLSNRHDFFEVRMKLSRKDLDEYGHPSPQALWLAERTFLQGYNNKHLPNVRLTRWRAHLKGDAFVLSEYRVLLPASTD